MIEKNILQYFDLDGVSHGLRQGCEMDGEGKKTRWFIAAILVKTSGISKTIEV